LGSINDLEERVKQKHKA